MSPSVQLEDSELLDYKCSDRPQVRTQDVEAVPANGEVLLEEDVKDGEAEDGQPELLGHAVHHRRHCLRTCAMLAHEQFTGHGQLPSGQRPRN